MKGLTLALGMHSRRKPAVSKLASCDAIVEGNRATQPAELTALAAAILLVNWDITVADALGQHRAGYPRKLPHNKARLQVKRLSPHLSEIEPIERLRELAQVYKGNHSMVIRRKTV